MLLVIILGAWYFYPSQIVKPNTSLPKTRTAVSISYVTIPTSVNESQAYPTDTAATAKGHYAYIDTGGSLTDPFTAMGGKLIYDGSTIYSGSDLVANGTVISNNGLHYAYIRYGHSSARIYLDNVLVKTLSDLSAAYSLELNAVSNNGHDYAYTLDQQAYKDGVALYPMLTMVNAVKFSADLSHYIMDAQQATGSAVSNAVIRDGKTLSMNAPATTEAIAISPNGLHAIYAVNGTNGRTYTLFVDSKRVGTTLIQTGNTNVSIVNNNASYAFSDYARGLIDNNGEAITIPATLPDNCETSCSNLFSINQSATQYVVGDNRPVGESSTAPVWELDGKPTTLQGDVEGLEFDNNILFVYRWSD